MTKKIPHPCSKAESVKFVPEPSVLDPRLGERELSLNSPISRMLAHYANSIATMMVWIDSEQNEYRKIIVPLAKVQETLMLSILAVVSTHRPGTLPTKIGPPGDVSETAVLQITERLRSMARDAMVRDCEQHEAFIAAALILSNYALLNSELSVAWIHLNAVRVLIRTAALSTASNAKLFSFLKNQAAAFDVLACTATFDPAKIEGVILPEIHNDNVMFGLFLLTLQGITSRHLSQEAAIGSLESLTTISEVENQLELARASTLRAAESLSSSSSKVFSSKLIEDDFVRMVQVYHHAGVLYAHLRLTRVRDPVGIEYHSSRLFQTLDSFEDYRATCHNLAWPLFIAGICCWPNIDRMKSTRKLTQIVAENTQFGHYGSIVRFHQCLWESPHLDWINLATDWESRGTPLIPV